MIAVEDSPEYLSKSPYLEEGVYSHLDIAQHLDWQGGCIIVTDGSLKHWSICLHYTKIKIVICMPDD